MKRKMAERTTLRTSMGKGWTKRKKGANPIEKGEKWSKI